MNLQVGQEVTYANGEKGKVISVTAKMPNSVVTQCQHGHIHYHNEEGDSCFGRNIIPPFKEGDAVWVSFSGQVWFARVYIEQCEGMYLVAGEQIRWDKCKKYVVGEKP